MSGPPPEAQVTWPEAERMFDEFEHTAFRLETLQNYAVEYEDELFARFLTAEREGLPAPLSDDDWQQEVRDGTAAGRSYSRVHVVIEPLTDYVRFECASGYRSNIAAVRTSASSRRATAGGPREYRAWTTGCSTPAASGNGLRGKRRAHVHETGHRFKGGGVRECLARSGP